jgi:membrane-bound metal-dependent hydrolase YbcI (DUF457 family)
MAGYKGHIVGALVCDGIYVAALRTASPTLLHQTAGLVQNWQTAAALLVIGVLFGLWPDVDTNSMGQNIFFGLAFAADIILIATGRFEAAAYLGLLAMTPIIGHHRGWTHSFLAMVLVPLPILLVPYLYRHEIVSISILVYGAALIGYFSHLLLDGRVIKSFAIHSKRSY